MGFFTKIFYLSTIIIIIIIICSIITYYYFKNYIQDYLLNYDTTVSKLQGFDKLKNEQHILRDFIFGTPNINKRFLIQNLINKNEINIFKKIFNIYSKDIESNINNQINVNLINSYGKIPKNEDILIIDKIIDKIKKRIELLYHKILKLNFYTICLNKKNSTVFPHCDCKSFDIIKKKFINNMCPDRHYSVTIPLNNNYKGGNFKFCNDNKIIDIKKGNGIIFDGNEVHEVTTINENKRLVLIIWFQKI